MTITCPKNKKHDRFEVTAHVSEFWIVNKDGQYVEVVDDARGEVVHRPDSQDHYVCAKCGAEAQVTAA